MTVDRLQTGGRGRPNGPDRVIKILRWIPIAGYILAQVLVCVVWSRRVAEIGVAAGEEPGEVLGSFIVIAIPAVVPALILGVLDGIAGAGRRPSFTFARILVAPALLLLCVFWILPLGEIALGTEDFYGRKIDPLP